MTYGAKPFRGDSNDHVNGCGHNDALKRMPEKGVRQFIPQRFCADEMGDDGLLHKRIENQHAIRYCQAGKEIRNILLLE